jgi:aspartate aminotransferase
MTGWMRASARGFDRPYDPSGTRGGLLKCRGFRSPALPITMFEQLKPLAPDPILGLMAAFRIDPAPMKIDLGVGVYKDENGNTPVLEAVREAERRVLEAQTTKVYVGPAGNPGFNAAMTDLVLGSDHPAHAAGRVRTVQGCGGCATLRVGAELIKSARPGAVIHVSNPTWANHVPLLGSAGLKLEQYPYYDVDARVIDFSAMISALERAEPGHVVLLHGCCHNPTGADLTADQWRAVVDMMRRRELVAFVDVAYQGFAEGIEADVYGARLVASELPEALIAVSCSKNFGLYRERVGALVAVSRTAEHAEAASSHLQKITRGLYSMPPDHGAAIVERVLHDSELRSLWVKEVAAMRDRINRLRILLVEKLATRCSQRDFTHVARQRGMFSFLGVTPDEVRRLREEFHIYMTDNSRVNIAGVSERNIDYLAESVATVVAG